MKIGLLKKLRKEARKLIYITVERKNDNNHYRVYYRRDGSYITCITLDAAIARLKERRGKYIRDRLEELHEGRAKRMKY